MSLLQERIALLNKLAADTNAWFEHANNNYYEVEEQIAELESQSREAPLDAWETRFLGELKETLVVDMEQMEMDIFMIDLYEKNIEACRKARANWKDYLRQTEERRDHHAALEGRLASLEECVVMKQRLNRLREKHGLPLEDPSPEMELYTGLQNSLHRSRRDMITDWKGWRESSDAICQSLRRTRQELTAMDEGGPSVDLEAQSYMDTVVGDDTEGYESSGNSGSEERDNA